MEKVIEFLTLYYREIIDISVLIISVVICLIRKRPCINEIDSIKKDVLDYLPTLICLVEKPGDGAQKKSTVMDLLFAYIYKKYHIDEFDDTFIKFVEDAIESILSTPTKKGENYGEKRK